MATTAKGTGKKTGNVSISKLYGKNIRKLEIRESVVVKGLDTIELHTVSGATVKIAVHNTGTLSIDIFPEQRGDNVTVYDSINNNDIYNKFERESYPADENIGFFQAIHVKAESKKYRRD